MSEGGPHRVCLARAWFATMTWREPRERTSPATAERMSDARRAVGAAFFVRGGLVAPPSTGDDLSGCGPLHRPFGYHYDGQSGYLQHVWILRGRTARHRRA